MRSYVCDDMMQWGIITLRSLGDVTGYLTVRMRNSTKYTMQPKPGQFTNRIRLPLGLLVIDI